MKCFLGDHNKSFICRQCSNSYTNENALMIHKEESGSEKICTIGTSSASHLHWKKDFHKNVIDFRIYAAFEVDNEIDKSNIGY